MRSLLFTICLIAAFAFNAHSQKMAAQLQAKKWYVTGNVGNGTMVMRTNQGKAPSDWEAKFSSTGSMHNCATLKKTMVDATGIEQKAGTFYCDSFYVYSVKNDMLSIMQNDKTFYYRIKSLANNEGVELAPASKEDFK